ncbi:hydantoinase/carbamoylase family amidase [Vineibacter terrae]|uniref:hydantoinase/carbamoylase family amidase n=1 Tax=Vineibacter terrae TaxID=2586908 RepID=UPI002E30EDEE|nr:hydantoinase/carbamoylase family amidase [Vineibacter terrae]HEX2884811.1 hydantoinase/carbamoylase family amidase [Vineibacter terrae]
MNRALAGELLETLARLGHDGVGITRDSYGKGETAALRFLAQAAQCRGLRTALDAAGNLMIDLPGHAGGPAVWIGSHLDSVPQGGNFDGAAGIVAGLLCLVRLHDEGIVPPRPVRVVALRGEESAWYGRAHIGSRALFGALDAHDLACRRRDDGSSLADGLVAAGADLARIRTGAPLVDPQAIAAYLELHIEQGPVMVARNLPTAVVTAIRGNIRHGQVICRGEAGHSGAVPRWLRRDAVFATAELITRLDAQWRALLDQGADLVVTTGIVATPPEEHAMSRIPGKVRFSFEIRSQSQDTLAAFYQVAQAEAEAVGHSRGVAFDFGPRANAAPARMDDGLVRQLLALSGRHGLPAETLPSGAGHDAAVFAQAGIPSAMIFVRNANGSHNPREALDLDDLMAGTRLLYAAVTSCRA